MEPIAFISDIHGNLTALETVLADIERRGIETIYCLGDVVGKGPHSARVLDVCRERCQVIVRGNWDESIGGTYEHPVFDWHRAQLGAERLAYLADLPNSFDFWLSGKKVRVYHASHVSAYHRIFPDAEYATHLTMFADTAFTGSLLPEPDVVVYGDVHVAFARSLHRDRKSLFNPGSVGNPLDEPLATYGILRGEWQCQRPAALSWELVRLPYDIEGEIGGGAGDGYAGVGTVCEGAANGRLPGGGRRQWQWVGWDQNGFGLWGTGDWKLKTTQSPVSRSSWVAGAKVVSNCLRFSPHLSMCQWVRW